MRALTPDVPQQSTQSNEQRANTVRIFLIEHDFKWAGCAHSRGRANVLFDLKQLLITLPYQFTFVTHQELDLSLSLSFPLLGSTEFADLTRNRRIGLGKRQFCFSKRGPRCAPRRLDVPQCFAKRDNSFSTSVSLEAVSEPMRPRLRNNQTISSRMTVRR